MNQALDAAAAASAASARPASHPTLHRGKWNRKFGRYDFHRFDHVTSEQASIGGASIGKVDVDCKLLFKKSQWGFLGGDRPAGIIYMDIDFHQPEDHRLVWASIQVTVDDNSLESLQSLEPPANRQIGMLHPYYPVQMTPWFGPQHIVGPEKIKHKTETLNLTPHIQVAGNGAGGIGKTFQATFEAPYRWKFSGHLVRPDGKLATGNQYKTLEWELKENDLDPGQSNKVHTAFAFEYGGQPFLMKVKVKGGLQKMHHRLRHNMRSLRFGPRANHDEDSSTTLIKAYRGRRRPLDAIARSLEQAMEMENYKRRPLELPEPQPATYQQVAPETIFPSSRRSEEQEEGTSGTPPSPPARISARPQAHLQQASAIEPAEDLRPSFLSVPSDPTLPTLGNLARAGRSFARPARELIREDRSDISLLSSTATLVEQSEDSPSLGQIQPAKTQTKTAGSDGGDMQLQAAVMKGMWDMWMMITALFRMLLEVG